MASKKKIVKKAAKKSKPAKKALPLLNMKCSSKDRKVLEAKAKKHAGGNLSAWLRYAGSNYVPPKNAVIR